jgi:nitrogen fixation protein FixH
MTLARRWLFVCVGLLLGNVAVMAILVTASTWSAPTVLPHYYERAVEWDRAMAEVRTIQQLGWRLDLTFTTEGAALAVHDADGAPVPGVTVRASGFHRSEPARAIELELTSGADGTARAVPRDRDAKWPATPGWYELDLEVHRGEVRYAQHRTVELRAAPLARLR